MRLRLAAALALCVLLAGCDTTDPEPPVSPDDVAGLYDLTEFQFDPQAGAIADADVLDRLEPGATIDLLNTQRGGQFQLRYQFAGELPDIISGDFAVTQGNVTLTVREQDRASLPGLLLDPEIVFVRESETVLSRSVTKSVNLEAFDADAYGGAGLTDVRGTLTVRLVQREP
ncbi:MAG: hypothetical protein AAGI91_15490 [Bacteroidota bacterium]